MFQDSGSVVFAFLEDGLVVDLVVVLVVFANVQQQLFVFVDDVVLHVEVLFLSDSYFGDVYFVLVFDLVDFFEFGFEFDFFGCECFVEFSVFFEGVVFEYIFFIVFEVVASLSKLVLFLIIDIDFIEIELIEGVTIE